MLLVLPLVDAESDLHEWSLLDNPLDKETDAAGQLLALFQRTQESNYPALFTTNDPVPSASVELMECCSNK
jgi:hypothetical protein